MFIHNARAFHHPSMKDDREILRLFLFFGFLFLICSCPTTNPCEHRSVHLCNLRPFEGAAACAPPLMRTTLIVYVAVISLFCLKFFACKVISLVRTAHTSSHLTFSSSILYSLLCHLGDHLHFRCSMSFQPTCSMCVADCDATSILTSCPHFLCARCYNKHPKGQCPRCHKACKTVPLNAPNFPADVQERIRFDMRKHLTMSVQAFVFQQQLDHSAMQRLKEITTQLHQQLRSTMQQLGEAQRHAQHKAEESKTLQVEVNVLRDQLREVHMGGRSSSGAPSHHITSRATPAMPLAPQGGGDGPLRSPSAFRCDAFSDVPHGAAAVDVPPLSPFGVFGTSRLTAGLPMAPSPRTSRNESSTQHQSGSVWSPSSASATPLGWSRAPAQGEYPPKRPRDDGAPSISQSGGAAEHFRLGNLLPPQTMQPRHPAAAVVNGNSSSLASCHTPLPKLSAVMPSGGARLVRPSSGHEF